MNSAVSPPHSAPRSLSPKQGFGEVARDQLPVLYRVAKRMTYNETVAEDLVGTTLVTAHRLWPTFDGEHPRSWLIKLMRNEWHNLRRREEIRSTVSFDVVGEVSDECFWHEIGVQLDAKTLLAAIDRLPEDFGMVVTLCDVEELSYEETASILDIPIGTVRSRLFRARKLLRSTLASQIG